MEDAIRLTIEDSGNIEQVAISIQNIEKILKRIEKKLKENDQNKNK